MSTHSVEIVLNGVTGRMELIQHVIRSSPHRRTTDLDEALQSDTEISFDTQITSLRIGVVCAAIEAGKHVYCEEPTAESCSDARGIGRLRRLPPEGRDHRTDRFVLVRGAPWKRSTAAPAQISDGSGAGGYRSHKVGWRRQLPRRSGSCGRPHSTWGWMQKHGELE